MRLILKNLTRSFRKKIHNIAKKFHMSVFFHVWLGTSPVTIQATGGQANLVLTSTLDKEGISGPASLTVGVVCERLGTTDPGFTIPISIRVTDVNDNAPVFLGAPYTLNVSELSLVGSVLLGEVLAVDVDQPGAFSTVEYHIKEGPFSDYVAFENPLEGRLVLTKERFK